MEIVEAALRRPPGVWLRWTQGGRLRSPVKPTAFGLAFILLALVTGLAAVNTGNNLLFLVFAMMLAALVVSGVSSRASLRRLTTLRRLPATIYAGTAFTEAVTIRNGKRLFPTVSLSLRTPIATSTVHLPYVPARASRTLVLEGLYPKRGRFRVERLELSSLYPFALFERRTWVGTDQTVTVYPHVDRIVPFFPERSGGLGEHTARFKGEGDDLYQIREYVPGESARSIDWKATSRVGKLMARDHHQISDLRVTLIVDSSAAGPEEVEAIEQEISLAASMIDYLERRATPYQLLVRSGFLPFGTGPLQYREAMTRLALIEVVDHETGSEFLRGLSAEKVRDSVVLYFTARGHAPDLPVRAFRVLPSEKSVDP